MRWSVALFLTLALLAVSTADADRQKTDHRLRLALQSDGLGNSVFVLEIGDAGRDCDVRGAPVANYLFVNKKAGNRRWLFPEPQPCIRRMFQFASRPQATPVKPAEVQAVVYDVTPSCNLSTWEHNCFRFCTGTNPCLPLRRIFVSRADGRNLTPLTPTFQILDPDLGPPSITQRKDGIIDVSFRDDPHGARAAFSVDTFKVPQPWPPTHLKQTNAPPGN